VPFPDDDDPEDLIESVEREALPGAPSSARGVESEDFTESEEREGLPRTLSDVSPIESEDFTESEEREGLPRTLSDVSPIETEEPITTACETVLTADNSVDVTADTVMSDSPAGVAETVDLGRAETPPPSWRDRLRVGLKKHEADREARTPKAPDGLELPARFEYLGELGRGGAGVVVAALDTKLKRKVALKMLLSGSRAHSEELRRFKLEAQAAARLRHPNIVSVYEVGELNGRPYLVMEWVEGESLQSLLKRDGPLSSKQAAGILLRLGEALQHAHSRSILHRDLKPGNVLLATSGEPLITDFGLAKVIDSEGSKLTVTGQVMGTPAYMPPEQATGDLDAIDCRADVYSLGATLYDLLAGAPPFVGDSVLAILAKVNTQLPLPPSVHRDVDRALETICLKCLEKDPGDRYPSALELVQDLRRYLANQKVLARRATVPEQAQRWVRRNRTLARAVGLVAAVAALVLGLQLFVSSREIRAERDQAVAARAEMASAKAIAVERQVEAEGAQREAERARSKEVEARRLAESRQLEAERAKAEEVAARELAGRRRVEAELAGQREATARKLAERRRGEAEKAKGEEAAARRLAERHRDQAVAARKATSEARVRETAAKEEAMAVLREVVLRVRDDLKDMPWEPVRKFRADVLRQTVKSYGRLQFTAADPYRQLGDLAREASDTEDAARAYGKAVEISRAVVEREPKAEDSQRDLIRSLKALAHFHRYGAKIKLALTLYREALAIERKLIRLRPDNAIAQRELATALASLGETERLAGNGSAALPLFSEALKIHREIYKAFLRGNVDSAHPILTRPFTQVIARQDLARALLDQATMLTGRGKLQEALVLSQEALAHTEAIFANNVESVKRTEDTVRALGHVADLQISLGRRADAREPLERALRLNRKLVSRDPTSQATRRELLGSLVQLGQLDKKDEGGRALETYLEALELARALINEDKGSPLAIGDLASVVLDVAAVREARGEIRAALTLYGESLTLRRKLLAMDPENLGRMEDLVLPLLRIGVLRLLHLGNPNGALKAHEECARIGKRMVKRDPKRTKFLDRLSMAYEGIGDSKRELRDSAGAMSAYLECLRLGDQLIKLNPNGLSEREGRATTLVKVGRIHRDLEDFDSALPVFEEACALLRGVLKESPEIRSVQQSLSACLGDLGEALHRKGRVAECQQSYEDALVIAKRLAAASPTIPAQRQLLVCHNKLAQVLHTQRRLEKGLVHYEASVALARGLVAREPRSPTWLLDLTRTLATTGRLQQERGEPEAALVLYREAKVHLTLLIEIAPRYQSFTRTLDRWTQSAETQAGRSVTASPEDQVELAYVKFRKKDYPAALKAFRLALTREALRSDLGGGHLYNAACAASLASLAAKDEEALVLRKEALGYLLEDLRLRRDLLSRVDADLQKTDLPPELRDRIQAIRKDLVQHFEHARTGDADLIPLRELPEFKGISWPK
jgi:eukaryotic-like serine/threonine-protein kinase